jgi:hypothetical protein
MSWRATIHNGGPKGSFCNAGLPGSRLAPIRPLDRPEMRPAGGAGARLIPLRSALLFVLLPLAGGCADQGVYTMWNPDTLQQVDCRKSEAFGASDAPPGYRRSLPYSCIAACEQAGFAGSDRALERSLAVADLRGLARLPDSEVPPLCRGDVSR